MAFTDTAAILDSLKALIEALTPSTDVVTVERYQVEVGDRNPHMGSRAVFLTCQPGRRLPEGGTYREPWEAYVTVETGYVDTPGARQEQTVYGTAVADAEAILAAIYDWEADNDCTVEPDIAQVIDTGDGELTVARQLRIVYQRGT